MRLQIISALMVIGYLISANAYAIDASKPSGKHEIIKNACTLFAPDSINIPGTTTCIKLYGQISGTIFGGSTLSSAYFDGQPDNKHHVGITTQGRLGADIYAPSSLGTIHGKIEMRAGLNNGLGYINYNHNDPVIHPFKNKDNNYLTTIHYAYAELGGFRFGIDHSIFNYWANNFGTVENDNIQNSLGYIPLNAISYNFTYKNGLSAILGLESSNRTYMHSNLNTDIFKQIKNTSSPESAGLVGGLKCTQDWGDLIALGAYDSYYSSSSFKLRIDNKINSRLNLFALAALKSMKDSYALLHMNLHTDDVETAIGGFTRFSNWSRYGDWDGAWQTMIGGSYIYSPQLIFNTQLGYSAAKTATMSINAIYNLAPNLTITPEFSYIQWNDDTTIDVGKLINIKHLYIKNFLKGKHEAQALLKLCYKF